MLSAYQLVWMAAERTPDHLAIVDDASDRAVTYKELIAEVDRVAAGLRERGVAQGDRIATVLPGLYDHCICLLALQRLAAVPALINFRLSPGEIGGLVKDGQMAGALTACDQTVAAALRDSLPGDAPIFSLGGKTPHSSDFADCRADPHALPPTTPDGEDPAFIFYTSGTTGLPKGVVLPHRASEHRVLWLATQAGLRQGTHTRALGFMPLSHAIGFFGVFLATLANNGTYYVMSAFNPVEALNMVEKHAITYMFAVPQLFHAMLKAPNYAPAKMSSLELSLFGGAAIDPAALRQIDAEWGGVVRHIYGTTETMCSLNNPDPVGQHTRLRPGMYARIRLVRPGGRPDETVGPGEEGELIVDAGVDTIFTEYLNRPDATAEKIVDGWYYTGDVCLQLEDGDVELIGRTDDVIRSGGETIHPEEIEAHLARAPGVGEAAVIGVQDEKWGEAVTACLVGDDLDIGALDDYLRGTGLSGFKRPKNYLLLARLPRNAANKVLRRDLRAIAHDAAGKGELLQPR